jgi:hypothetical protein
MPPIDQKEKDKEKGQHFSLQLGACSLSANSMQSRLKSREKLPVLFYHPLF